MGEINYFKVANISILFLHKLDLTFATRKRFSEICPVNSHFRLAISCFLLLEFLYSDF